MRERASAPATTGASASVSSTPSAPSAPVASTAADPASSVLRHSGSFTSRAHRRRYVALVVGLAILSLALSFGVLSWNNPMEFGTEGYWLIAKMRATSLLVIAVVVTCQAFATVSFQTAAANRIITPSIMGFEALYVVLNTAAVFFLGAAGVTLFTGIPQFFLQVALMVGFSALLYGWLLGGKYGNMHVMLLVGVIMGGGLGSLSTFMQRMLDPSTFDILTARMFGNISNARTEYLPYAIPIVILAAGALYLNARRLNLLALGRDTATNLGLNHRRDTMIVLLLVSILMAMTTSLVGPMTFLGFLIATLAYQFTDTYDHRLILPVAALTGYTVLTAAYFVLRHVFSAQGAVTIIIEVIGGLTFLIVVMRKGRL
ncbi:MAG: iron chelate uptake ABC transporter family permease subunit [Dermabacter sp.]|nr:iron chelate uptake ABC transporter family permease subunit [Dermabacter sp.]